jgi:hypothetical protein
MIELNRIRSMETLEELRKDLTDFINYDRAELLKVYAAEYGWGEEDLDADLEKVSDLLSKVERRIVSLGNYLSQAIMVKNGTPQSGAEVSASALQPAS